MIDLHCHILPGIDDGAPDLSVALDMARASVADGVTDLACTPHILPGRYPNTGPQIRQATGELQDALGQEGIPLRLVAGADNHVALDFVGELKAGQLLSLNGSRYVLVEPPHAVLPPRLEELFVGVLAAGYVPILTHPERLSWIKTRFDLITRLAQSGVWMQVTAGSLAGAFGSNAQYWGERMLDEGLIHILATDAHDIKLRAPNLSVGRYIAAARVGEGEAEHLVATRPRGVLENVAPSSLPTPERALSSRRSAAATTRAHDTLKAKVSSAAQPRRRTAPSVGSSRWLRRFFE